MQTLREDTLQQQIHWFEDFEKWQAAAFWSDLRIQAERLVASADQKIAALGSRLARILAAGEGAAQTNAILTLNEFSNEASQLTTVIRTNIERRLREAFARELQRDNQLLDELLAFLRTLGSTADTVEDLDDPDGDDEEDETRPRGEREEAFEAYTRAARTQARAVISKRSVSRRSRHGRILQWLGTRSLTESECLTTGQMLQVQTALRRFSNPLRQFIDRIPARYRQFRRARQANQQWYVADAIESNWVSPLEVDAILLIMLRGARAFLRNPSVISMISEPRFITLKTIHDLYRTQVLVDEATDFSPLQLACMASLCDPEVQSFLACGDFNQRITEWGSRSSGELKWVCPDFDIRTIDITYRHSRQLNELARALAALSKPETPLAALPPHVNSEGVLRYLLKTLTARRP